MATAEVELDIFSGRPNPTWALTDSQTASLLEMLDGLPQTESEPRPGDLGYRGMIVRLRGAKAREITVHTGVAAVNGGSHADADRHVERWLLETGRPFLDPSIYDIVKAEL
jgi:hypothetical protein